MTELSFSNVGVDFGATHLFSNVTFTVAQQERWGVVGRNGTGKTTLSRSGKQRGRHRRRLRPSGGDGQAHATQTRVLGVLNEAAEQCQRHVDVSTGER